MQRRDMRNRRQVPTADTRTLRAHSGTSCNSLKVTEVTGRNARIFHDVQEKMSDLGRHMSRKGSDIRAQIVPM